jgi:hypothetical protein
VGAGEPPANGATLASITGQEQTGAIQVEVDQKAALCSELLFYARAIHGAPLPTAYGTSVWNRTKSVSAEVATVSEKCYFTR